MATTPELTTALEHTTDEAAREALQDSPPIRERATTTAWVVRQ